MDSLETIRRLCGMLDTAQQIIQEQAELLAMHEIVTSDGSLEKRRECLLQDIAKTI